uniref:Uncharacterized protein n=1 Tax=Oryza sativa subsp. japonica TaxID=39947 RepID=Q7EYD4_ORYSJ|nr:hypothetical protein [Oryza sativa Japonica Group]BAD33534.1 hypothetical protein [Oryza sativa Japonica Group]
MHFSDVSQAPKFLRHSSQGTNQTGPRSVTGGRRHPCRRRRLWTTGSRRHFVWVTTAFDLRQQISATGGRRSPIA